MKQKEFEGKIIEFLMILMFSFGIVTALFSLISIELNVYDFKLYFMLFLAVIIIYKPFRIASCRFLFYSVGRIMQSAKNFFLKNENEQMELNHVQPLQDLQFLKSLFEKRGYVAVVTKDLESFDVDLILWKGTKKYIVQTFHLQRAVSIRNVQKVVVKMNSYMADGAMIIANQPFTESAKKFSSLHHIQLFGHDDLLKIHSENKKFIFQTALSFILHHK